MSNPDPTPDPQPQPLPHSATGTVVASRSEVVADLSAQNRNPLSLEFARSLLDATPSAPPRAPVAINASADDRDRNALNQAVDLPVVDAHTHIQGMSLQNTTSDPYQRPKWVRRNMRQGFREATLVMSGAVAFVEYSATNDEVVAHMGLKQLNYWGTQNRAKLLRKDGAEMDSVMVTLGMDFGFTPLMCGQALRGGGRVMAGGRMDKCKETARHYFINDGDGKVEFSGDPGLGDKVVAQMVDWALRTGLGVVKSTPPGVKAVYWVTSAGMPCAILTVRNDDHVLFDPPVWGKDATNRDVVPWNGSVFVAPPTTDRDRLVSRLELVDGLRKALGATGFTMKVGTKTFSAKALVTRVPDPAKNKKYYAAENVPPEILRDAWVRVVDSNYYSDAPEGPPEAFYYLNQKDQNYKNTIEAMWRVASFQCGRIWPLCPFDPRRANALDFVKEAVEKKGHIGVKTYTRTFWMPTGNEAMYGKDVGPVLDARADELFQYLVAKDIPLLNHTSPTGWPAWPVYPEQYTADKAWNLVPPHPDLDDRKNGTDAQTNRTPYRISWQEVGSIWRKGDDASGHPQYAAYDALEETVAGFLQGRGTDRFECAFRAAIVRNAARVAHYNLYVQLCVSPSAWKPVLRKYPALRLNLAHAGSKLTPYTFYEIDTVARAENALKGDGKPEVNVMIAPKVKTPASGGRGGFKELFIAGVAHVTSEELYDGLAEIHPGPEAIAERTAALLGTPAWTAWFDAWHARFGDDGWWVDLMGLLHDYPNVYSDFSYYCESEDDMVKILEPIIDAAVHGGTYGATILEKTMLGSDWFMTEADSLSSEKYWPMFLAAVENHWKTKKGDLAGATWTANPKYKELWLRWVTLNALRCYNLKRADGQGMTRLEEAYKGFRTFIKEREGWKMWYTVQDNINLAGDTWIKSLPKWWPKLKTFYGV